MSNSQYVCWKDGIPLSTHRGAWRHALGRNTGSIPPHRKHKPVACPRAEYERFSNPDTPRAEALAIKSQVPGAVVNYQNIKAEVATHMAAAQTWQYTSQVADKVAGILGVELAGMSGLTSDGRKFTEQVRRALNQLAASGVLDKRISTAYGRRREASFITHAWLAEIERETAAERERQGIGRTAYVSGWSGKVVALGKGGQTVILEYTLPTGVSTRVPMPADLVKIGEAFQSDDVL